MNSETIQEALIKCLCEKLLSIKIVKIIFNIFDQCLPCGDRIIQKLYEIMSTLALSENGFIKYHIQLENKQSQYILNNQSFLADFFGHVLNVFKVK